MGSIEALVTVKETESGEITGIAVQMENVDLTESVMPTEIVSLTAIEAPMENTEALEIATHLVIVDFKADKGAHREGAACLLLRRI